MVDQNETIAPDELRRAADNLRCAASCRSHHDAADKLEGAAERLERLRAVLQEAGDDIGAGLTEDAASLIMYALDGDDEQVDQMLGR